LVAPWGRFIRGLHVHFTEEDHKLFSALRRIANGDPTNNEGWLPLLNDRSRNLDASEEHTPN
jgi:hypothetical protein